MRIKCLLAALLISVASFAQFVDKHGQLKVIGTQLSDQDGEAVSLRGLSFGWHNWWPRFYNREAVQWLKSDFNVTVLRAAMGVDADENCYIQNPSASRAKVEAVVEACIEQNIYVIIDWHSHKVHTPEAVAFFTEMSRRYGKHPNVIYEIFNEPVNQSWTEVKTYSEAVIKAIRKNDPDNVILVGNPHWDQDLHLVAQDPITGYDNLMYTMHFYAATHKKELRDRVDGALAKGIPIFVSESAGMEATGDGPLDYGSWQEWIDWMETKKLSWVTWSVADKNETCSILNKSAASDGRWKNADLKESGKKIREYLQKYNAPE